MKDFWRLWGLDNDVSRYDAHGKVSGPSCADVEQSWQAIIQSHEVQENLHKIIQELLKLPGESFLKILLQSFSWNHEADLRLS